MDRSDDYDDDDFFADPETLAALDAAEEIAISASQQVRVPVVVPQARQSQRYHHTVNAPRVGPSAALWGKRKDGTPRDPPPLNTQPGSKAGGFGWEHGGKRVAEGNLQRNLDAIDERQAYWAGGSGGKKDEDEEMPAEITVDPTGRYARSGPQEGEDDVVDNRHQPISESLAAQSQAFPRRTVDPKSAEARRAAIAAALGRTSENTNAPKANGMPPPPLDTTNFGGHRTFARSVSAGSLVRDRPQPIAGPSRLEPIASQAGSQGSSQGSAVRRLHLDLESERRQREALERELAALRQDAERAGNRSLWRDEVDAEEDVDLDAEERKRQYKALQLKVYEAEGKAATMERNKQKDISRYTSEIDKLKAGAETLQAQLLAKEKEHKQHIESLKTQAVFNNHAVINSVAKARVLPSSQRPAIRNGYTPGGGGSPSRKGQIEEATPLVRTSHKGKGKALPPIPQPGFRSFVNAFDGPDTATRSKRQRTEGPSPVKHARSSPARQSQNGLRTPEPSPTKARSQTGMLIEDEPPDEYGGEMFVDQLEVMEDESASQLDMHVELLRHLFHYAYVCPSRFDSATVQEAMQPTLFRIINHHPEAMEDTHGEYAKACSRILRACGDPDLDCDGILRELAVQCSAILALFAASLAVRPLSCRDTIALCDVLALLSRTAASFPTLVDLFIGANDDVTLGTRLKSLLPRTDQQGKDQAKCIGAGARDIPPITFEQASVIVDLLEVVCLVGDGRMIWRSTELVDTILATFNLSDGPRSVDRAVDVFLAASCSSSHFRALIGPSMGSDPNTQPVLDCMARYLVRPQKKMTPEIIQTSIKIVRAFSMLAVSDPNGVLLIAERSVLAPCLVHVLQREVSMIWGINYVRKEIRASLELLYLSLLLMHHLVFPAPYARLPSSSSQSDAAGAARQKLLSAGIDAEPPPEDLPQGLNVASKLTGMTPSKEFNGIFFMLQSALGAMAFADLDLESLLAGEEGGDEAQSADKGRLVSAEDLRTIQNLSQDLLEAAVEGPDVDAIYEIYVTEEEAGDGADPARVGEEDGVDPDVYAEMDDVMIID